MKKNIKKGIKYIFSIPKTIFFNFKIFPIKIAIKMPVVVSNKINCKDTYRGCIEIKGKVKPFMITIGLGGSKAIPSQKGMLHFAKKNDAKAIFEGKTHLGEGNIVFVNNGTVTFGKNFSSNKNCFISSDNNMKFGEDVLLGWNVSIRDSDGHEIIYSDKKDKSPQVIIGNHVWICANSDILKGTEIGDDCVIAYRSCVCGLKATNNELIGGYPAKVIKNDVNWKK